MIVATKSDPEFPLNPIHGEWAQHRFFNAILPLVPRRGLALDVGAHIGLWTRALALKFKYVYAFEPVPENFACLVQNASYRNVKLENVALGIQQGKCQMVMPRGGNSGCWWAKFTDGDTPVTTIDDYRLNDVDLIKIDVEGLEGAVLQGAVATLTRCGPTVVFETNGLGQKHYGPEYIDPARLLGSWRYKFAARYGKNEVWVPY